MDHKAGRCSKVSVTVASGLSSCCWDEIAMSLVFVDTGFVVFIDRLQGGGGKELGKACSWKKSSRKMPLRLDF